MRRTVVCVVAYLGLSAGIARADELRGVIIKIDADKVTFTEGRKDATARTYDLAREVKVFRFVAKDRKELDPDGLKAEPLPNLPKGGVLAVITVTDGKVTEIAIPAKKKQ
jgi:hypothetical protein